MKKFVSLLFVIILGLTYLPHNATAFTPNGTTPLVIASQSFNIGNTSSLRFVVSAPEDVVANNSNIVDVQLHRRVASRNSLQSLATGAATARVIDTFSTTLRTVNRDADGRLVISTNATTGSESASSLSFSFDGIYPITLRIRDSATNTVLASVLTFVNKRSTTSASPLPVTALVRLTGPPSITADGQIAITTELREKVAHFVAFLATFNAPLTIGVQPEIISSLALSTQPEDAQLLNNLREQLRRFSVVTSTFMSTDVSLFADAQLDDEFIEQLRLGESTLNRLLPDVQIQRSTWIADTPLTTDAAQLLRKAGIASVILTPSAQRDTSTSQSRSLMARPEGRTTDYMSVLSVDASIATQLSDSTQQDSSATVGYRSAAEAIMEAEDLVASGRSSDVVRIVVSSLNGEILPGNAFNIAARALIGAEPLSMVDMGIPYVVTTQTPTISFRASAPDDADMRARQFTTLRNDLIATSSMTAETDSRRDLWAHMLAVGESSAISEPQVYLDGLRALLGDIRGAITITTPNTITLSGRNSIIRLQMRNNSTTELTVNVQLASAKLNLDAPERTVTLLPASTSEIEVPARALSNGRFPITVTVRTPAGDQDVIPRTTITARVNALAGYGQLVSISLLLVLAAWWWSHWRRGKLEAARATTVSS